jgi:parvulin-like peptidyl-prolyl isomerase
MTTKTTLRTRATIAGWPLAGALALLMVGCAAERPSLDEMALASVNVEPVTVRDLDDAFESSHQGHTALLAGPGAIRQFLEKTIDRRLLIQEARRVGLEDDAEIREAVGNLTAQRARDQLYKDEVTRPPEISEQAIQEAYEKMTHRYRVRHILTYTREDAEKAAARIRAGAAFGEVASQVSVSGTAGRGGDLGFVLWGILEPTLEAGIETMQVGEIRGPIENDQGWNLVQLEEKVTVKERPDLPAKLRDQIKTTLSKRATSRRSFEFFDEMRSRWKVQVFDEALSEKNLLEGPKGGPDAEQARQIVVATAGDRTIGLADLRARLNLEAAQKLPRAWAFRQIRSNLDDMIFAALLEQEALRRGYAERPAIAREADKLENALLLDRLIGTVIYPRVQVTDDEVRSFYDQNPTPFTEPEAVRLGMIALETEQDAEAVLQELHGGADFATLARNRSKDPVTARVGGDVGWMPKGKANPAVESAAFALKVGDVGVAKAEKAQFILKLEERRPARVQEFAAVKEKAQQMLLTQRRREEVGRWVARLREASEIAIDDAAIAQAVATYEEQVKEKAAAKSGKGEGRAREGH